MNRIDSYPVKRYLGYELGIGRPLLFGASIVPGGVNFSVYSMHATGCTLVLFQRGQEEAIAEIPFTEEFRIGNVYSMIVFGLNYEETEYAYRFDGLYAPEKGLYFDRTRLLLDPYAKAIGGMSAWGERNPGQINQYRSKIIADDYDWQGDRPLETPLKDLIIYECHVRGFTRDASSGVKYPGTFSGLREKIPYLKELGINCVELMPVYEFDEMGLDSSGMPRITNYWGYNPIAFFAPKAGYAALGHLDQQVDEFKNLVKNLHKAGIEVLLDVVFNHTAEGDERGPYISFRGIDNCDYYMMAPDGSYCNYSGCGNTMNCNNPVVRNMILDCLRYWVVEYHVDGFRFDLASIMTRDKNGVPLMDPPLLESLAFDPVLNKCKLIAEAWDAGGLYQVGSFPIEGHFSEWNGRYRDVIRRFLKGDDGLAGEAVTRILGSSDIYPEPFHNNLSSINFITCHDGFTMRDLVSYNWKHNEKNGEDNRDGNNDNFSWNCGEEGESCNPEILALRKRQMKNAFTMLLLSQGIPMLLSGDEFGHTQFGNNNAYCQDNESSWLNWNQLTGQKELFDYVKGLIQFRRAHPILRRAAHFHGMDPDQYGLPDVSMHGEQPWQPQYGSHSVAILYAGHYTEGDEEDDDILLLMNMNWEPFTFTLPKPAAAAAWTMEFCSEEGGMRLSDGKAVLRDRCVAVLTAKRPGKSGKEGGCNGLFSNVC